MTVSVLPPSPAAFAKANWDDVAPYFDELASRPLEESTIEPWLRAWSRLEELVTEAAAKAMIAYTIDTSDAEKEADSLGIDVSNAFSFEASKDGVECIYNMISEEVVVRRQRI